MAQNVRHPSNRYQCFIINDNFWLLFFFLEIGLTALLISKESHTNKCTLVVDFNVYWKGNGFGVRDLNTSLSMSSFSLIFEKNSSARFAEFDLLTFSIYQKYKL